MALDESPDKGALYRYADGELTTVLEPISLSNGLDWTGRPHVLRRLADQADRRAGLRRRGRANRRPFATIEEGVGVPDGIVIDDEGGVWVALYGGAQVRRYSPDGELDARSSRSRPTM